MLQLRGAGKSEQLNANLFSSVPMSVSAATLIQWRQADARCIRKLTRLYFVVLLLARRSSCFSCNLLNKRSAALMNMIISCGKWADVK